MATAAKAQAQVVASFPPFTFLENIIVRYDGSILVTAINPRCLFYLPPPNSSSAQLTPQTLCTFEEPAMGIVELEMDIFYISTTSVLRPGGPSTLWKLDMRSFSSSNAPPKPVSVLVFPPEARVLNGSAVLSPTVLLCADSAADCIWRVDVPKDGAAPSTRIWMKHSLLAHSNDPKLHDSPGVNGIKFNRKDSFVYFTTTAQTLFGRIRVDPQTLDPVGDPEEVAERGMMADDLIVDEEAGVAYVTTHRQNTIERISLHDGARLNCIGEPFHIDMIGPTAGSWGRGPNEAGKVAYFSTDGGIKNPHDGVVKHSKVLRISFPAM
ncbi:hypothetical protein BKA61DRAFT_178949 [Leptodontidium sp. MPI-SDFR-AT-0119]|nr:hypothetical protein BKA61DRAFT_178949 [Leptodontidium sp. MPI-SDFR-AT-0119]